MASKKVTAGQETLGSFAPKFAQLNDDVLFGEVWSREERLSPRDRSLITVTSLLTSGIFDSSLSFHLNKARENGVTKEEIAETLTHLAFYSGWPKAWVAFRLAKEIWTEDITDGKAQSGAIFPIGEPNEAFSQYFVGQSYLKQLTKEGVPIFNITFEPGCRNNWHIHKAARGGGQILLCASGKGWYQEWGKEVRALRPGDTVTIPANVKHWHGATKDSWFSHLAVEAPGENTANEWLEPVDEDEYSKLN
jgi:alkylhydroperoxidase/carboxymuconolactone decarboxylase family protein YurZ/quercetin dioxygenase-like cupin family protein